ncbi:MAG: hypothetical protein PHY44_02645 [Lachnospiraceae bacterium]|nr:hypothetical protein [Lachnospiraceae bacterium]
MPFAIQSDIKCYDYLSRKYAEMKMQNEKNKIKHRFAYMKTLVEQK